MYVHGGSYLAMMGRFGSGSRGKRRKNQTTERQLLLEMMHIRVLSEMCVSMYEWKGLENLPGVDKLFLEKTLFHSGLSVFYFDKRYDQFLAPRASQAGAVNIYDNPTKFRVEGRGFMGGTIGIDKCVPIWGSVSRIPNLDIVTLYAHKLAQIDRTIEINSRNARKLRIVRSSHDDRLTMANLDQAFERGDPAMFVTEQASNIQYDEKIDAIDLGVDMKDLEVLHILKVRLWNEVMALLGIDGANQDKKERLVAAEVGANDEQIVMSKRRHLLTREIACEQINSKFSLDLSVNYVKQDETMPGYNLATEGIV